MMLREPGAAKPVILIVDDDEDNRDVFAQFLTLRGCRVELAGDGIEALKRVATLLPDLVVLDLSMPGIDGWEVARRLKAEPATCTIPLLAVSGHALADVKLRARAAGVDGYLTKPVLPQQLVQEANRTLAAAGRPTC